MVTVKVNGAPTEVVEGTTLQSWAEQSGVTAKVGVALAVNGEVARRGTWGERKLREGDEILLITIAQGG